MSDIINNFLLRRLLLVVVLLFGLTGLVNAQLVTNGGFESSDTGIVSSVKGWVIQTSDTLKQPPVYRIVNNVVKEGTHAMSVQVNSVGTNAWDIQIVADSIHVVPGSKYLYSVWAKSLKAGAQANFTIGKYSFAEYNAIRPASLSTSWTQYTMAFSINDTEKVIRAPIHFSLAANSGNTIYIDNLQIVNISDSGGVWQGQPMASKQNKFVGNTYDPGSVLSSYYAHYWNQVSPANEGKWASVEHTQGVYSWSALDTIYNYAQAHGFAFKEHNLIWGAQQPSFISSLDSASQYQEIENWIKTCGQRYTNAAYCDVVNEPINTPPNGTNSNANYVKALGGSGATGWDWVIKSFQLARQYWSPNTKLVLNEYGVLSDNSINASIVKIARLLKDRGLIDGIGIQCHYFEFQSYEGDVYNYVNPLSMLQANLDSLAATGIPIYVSEFDINEPTDATQLASYQKYFPFLWKNNAVKGFTFWGYVEGEMWQTHAALLHYDGSERPAMTWLRNYLDTVTVVTSVQSTKNDLPQEYRLFNNYPNPFNPSTRIEYNIPKTSQVCVKVYDVLGREVQTLVNAIQSPGKYTVILNAQGLSSGVYFYRLSAGSFNETKKLMLLK